MLGIRSSKSNTTPPSSLFQILAFFAFAVLEARCERPRMILGLRRVERRHVNARHLMESRGRKLTRDPEATPRLQAAAAALWGTQEADEARCSSKGED